MKLLLDTNTLIDLVASRSPYDEDVRKLCVAEKFGDVQLWVSTQSFADAFYVLCKVAPVDKVKQALLATLEFFCICGTHASDLRAALESDWNDIEDYLIAYSAKHIPAAYLITRNRDLIDRSPVKAMTAHDFLSYMKDEFNLEYEMSSIP